MVLLREFEELDIHVRFVVAAPKNGEEAKVDKR
jgi:hypothetical protein